MGSEFHKEFDKVDMQIREFLGNYSKSTILQNYFLNVFESLFYGNLINNFFINLNQTNIKDYNLPRGKIGKIKRKYKNTQKYAKLALTSSLKNKKIDETYYNNFKLKIQNDFPEFQKIISEIEKEVGKTKEYLKNKVAEIKKSGKSDTNFNTFIITTILEAYVQREKCLPIGKKLDKILKVVAKQILPKVSQQILKALNKNSKKMLYDQRKYQKGFERRLYERWKKPLDILECLIRVSLESGEEQKNKLSKTTDNTNNFKREALIKTHTRALQISNEILILLKSGYADGANARWRSLYELAVISFFLKNNNNEVSKRYLEHEIVRKFKEAKDYRTHYKKLGYSPLGIREFNKIKRKMDELCKKYNDQFQKEYGWIPSSVLKDRNFKALEELVKLDKFRPHYNSASDSVHSGAKGFYRLGLMDDYQSKILLAGASNYGLADPIQITAISLLHVNICLLNLEPDFESIMQMQIMNGYVDEITIKAVSVQKQIKEDEESLKFPD
ncbi:MAG: DUF5677 domain-containing protein [Candidatus Methanoperedens sp.]